MTITARNRIIKGGVAVSVLLSLFGVAAFVLLCTNAPREAPAGLIRVIDLPSLEPFSLNFYAAASAALALALVGTFTLLRVYFLFEKTPSIEITFLSAGLIAVSAECLRLLVPFVNLWKEHPFMLIAVSRAVVFMRVFFVLSLLAGSVFSIEKTLQNSGLLLFFALVAAFFTAAGVPVNYSEPASAFFLIPGYSLMLSLIFALLLALSTFSFLLQAKAHHAPGYYKTAIGCLCLSAGWTALGICDCWALLGAGTILFVVGASLFIHSLHKLYLWQ